MIRTVTLEECLNYCVDNLTCVGVDVDYTLSPIQCWPHTNSGDYVDNHILDQLGTTSYQLLTRCKSTGWWTFCSLPTLTVYSREYSVDPSTLPKIKQIWFRRDVTRSVWTLTIFNISLTRRARCERGLSLNVAILAMTLPILTLFAVLADTSSATSPSPTTSDSGERMKPWLLHLFSADVCQICGI